MPPPEGPTSAVTLPGSATNDMPRSTGSFGAIEEPHVGEFHPRSDELQRRLVVVGRLGRGRVHHLEQHAHADEMVVEFEVEPREPLGRLIGEQERGEERDEAAGRRAFVDDQIAAVDDGERDREAAERLHQRARAVGDARPLVGLVLHVGDAGVEAAAHLVFERERLDDAQALQGLLQGLDRVRAAGELRP